MGIRRVAGLTWSRLLMRVDNSAGKGTSGMDKFGSVIDRMNMKLGIKFLNSLRIKTQLLKKLQRVIVVDDAPYSQKDGWRVTEAPWRVEQRPFCCSCGALSWFCGQVSSEYLTSRWMSRWRMLRSMGRCCLGKVDLLMAGRAAEVLLVSLSCPLPLLRTHPPSLLVCCIFVFAGMWATSTASGQLEV